MNHRDPILVDGVINGRLAARHVRAELKLEIAKLATQGIVPQVAFIRVGNDPSSEVYVGAKARACGWVGLRSLHLHLPEDTTLEELEAEVERLNQDDDVDAILVQLPLPEHLGKPQVLNLINPLKDVDGFHPVNLGALIAGSGPLQPCTPAGIMRMISMLGLDLVGKHAVVVGRSVIVGRPMSALLLRHHATVTSCHRYTHDLKELTRQADILVVATGATGLIRGDWIKEGAYVFDVGITRGDDGVLRGDVRFEEALTRAAGVTPVPGGVGPMTTAQLLCNTVCCARLRRGLANPEITRG